MVAVKAARDFFAGQGKNRRNPRGFRGFLTQPDGKTSVVFIVNHSSSCSKGIRRNASDAEGVRPMKTNRLFSWRTAAIQSVLSLSGRFRVSRSLAGCQAGTHRPGNVFQVQSLWALLACGFELTCYALIIHRKEMFVNNKKLKNTKFNKNSRYTQKTYNKYILIQNNTTSDNLRYVRSAKMLLNPFNTSICSVLHKLRTSE